MLWVTPTATLSVALLQCLYLSLKPKYHYCQKIGKTESFFLLLQVVLNEIRSCFDSRSPEQLATQGLIIKSTHFVFFSSSTCYHCIQHFINSRRRNNNRWQSKLKSPDNVQRFVQVNWAVQYSSEKKKKKKQKKTLAGTRPTSEKESD